MQEVTVSLAATAKEISTVAAVAAAWSEADGILTLQKEQRTALKGGFFLVEKIFRFTPNRLWEEFS